MDPDIDLDTVFGDGSARQGGIFGKLLGAAKRLVTGESLFTTIYSNQGATKRRVAFLRAARGVSLGIAFQRKLGTGFFGGEGFIMEKLDGDGMVFVHAGGTIVPSFGTVFFRGRRQFATRRLRPK